MDVYSTHSSREVDQNVCLLQDTRGNSDRPRLNFASQHLQKLYELLQVKAIKTSLYHLQTDGLVEHFKQRLK